MKSKIRNIMTALNVARSNNCDEAKSQEIKNIINELEPYAKIEEDLPIDFETFIKLHKNRQIVYFKKNQKSKTIHKGYVNYVFSTRKGVWYFVIYYCDIVFRLKHKGKTWALTKEELL